MPGTPSPVQGHTEFRVSLFPAHSELELASAERELARTLHQGTAMPGIGTPERL
ncbi:hypothetical protein [Streptomyces mirabilis]|uniref:hypothetical protein n=1 Tax=Streptomyces mirabilis TaxID=68239 RepID=UPI0033AE6DA0